MINRCAACERDMPENRPIKINKNFGDWPENHIVLCQIHAKEMNMLGALSFSIRHPNYEGILRSKGWSKLNGTWVLKEAL